MLSDLRYRLRALFCRDSVERELEEELREHMERLVRRHRDAGASREEAARRARLEFGGLEQVAEACRDSRGLALAEAVWADFRYAARLLRKGVAFNAIAVLTLALGIGASTAVFSVVRHVLLESLPYPDADRVVLPWRRPPAGINVGFDDLPWGRHDFQAFAARTQAFEAVGAFVGDAFNLAGAGEPVRLEGARVSAGFFPALGVAPAFGRAFSAAEDAPGRELEVVLSHRLWRQRFGGDPALIGRSISLNGQSYTVVGIMPAPFAFPRSAGLPASITLPREPEVWVPLALPPGPPHRGEPRELGVIGRLKAGVAPQRAQAELDLFARTMDREYPGAKGWFDAALTPLSRQLSGDLRRPLLLLLGAVIVVLLIGCANVANLLLARSLARERELALRAALGADRSRIVRQLLVESVFISGIGAAAGVFVARAGVGLARAFGPATVPSLRDVSLDAAMVMFAFGLAIVTGVVFGLVPALASTRQAADFSRDSGRVKGGPRDSRVRRLLLAAQVALALVLVIASGLLVRSSVHLVHVDGGFTEQRVLTFELTLPSLRYPGLERIVPLYTAVLDRIRDVPGVESAGIAETIPLGGAGESTALRVPGRPSSSADERPYASYTVVSPGYFHAAGTPFVRGRDFLPSDSADAPLVAIANRAMAEKFWPGQDAIGKAVGVPIVPKDMTIVGIVADVKHLSLREAPGPEIFVPYTQKPWPSLATMHVAVRSGRAPGSLLPDIRAAVAAVDAELPIANVATMSEIVDASVAQYRFSMLLLGAFAALAVALASVGLYGSLSYSVVQRTPEIGVRLALGARSRDIVGLIVADGIRVAAAGVAAGLVIAFAAMRLLSGFLYGIEPTDGVTFAAMSAMLLSSSALASYVPARRAAATDPLITMRAD